MATLPFSERTALQISGSKNLVGGSGTQILYGDEIGTPCALCCYWIFGVGAGNRQGLAVYVNTIAVLGRMPFSVACFEVKSMARKRKDGESCLEQARCLCV